MLPQNKPKKINRIIIKIIDRKRKNILLVSCAKFVVALRDCDVAGVLETSFK